MRPAPSTPPRPNPLYERRSAKPTMHPRRVTGGIRLQFKPSAAAAAASTDKNGEAQKPEEEAASTPGWSWASARWMRLAEDFAPGEQLAEGLEYAQLGQTRSLEIKAGQVNARVQGRMPNAYKVALRMPTFPPEQWEAVASAMAAQAKYAASLLAGELPTNIEDLFIPAGLRLFPTDPSGLSCSCDCDIYTGRVFPPLTPPPAARGSKGSPAVQPWCKHICCVMYLVAEKLSTSPLTIFSVRGLPETDLLERLRQQRALAGLQRSGGGTAPVYTAHVAGLPRADSPLDQSLHNFWSPPEPDALETLDMPIEPPEVSHPLLRRVGASPFAGAKFPLVGLLATCYDVISQAAIQGPQGEQGGQEARVDSPDSTESE